MRRVGFAGLFLAGLLTVAACGQSQDNDEPAAPPPLPAPAPVAEWVPSPSFPPGEMVCWDQVDPSKPGISTMVGSPSQIPANATNVRNMQTCNPPHLHDGGN